MTPPADGDAAPVGVQWTIQPVFEYAAYLETTAADNDPIETPTCRGTLCATLALTQGTLASRPLYRESCPVGATTLPCYRLDGGDSVEDAIARAELIFMHDGTGATCVHVVETSSSAQHVVLFTGDVAGPAPGWSNWYAAGQSYLQMQSEVGSSNAGSGAASTPINVTFAVMSTDMVSDTPDSSIFVNDFTTALGTSSLGSRSGANPVSALTWGGLWGGAGNFITGYLALVACWDDRLTTAQREAEQANMEAYFGGAFPL
jgi:hypothetical protein